VSQILIQKAQDAESKAAAAWGKVNDALSEYREANIKYLKAAEKVSWALSDMEPRQKD